MPSRIAALSLLVTVLICLITPLASWASGSGWTGGWGVSASGDSNTAQVSGEVAGAAPGGPAPAADGAIEPAGDYVSGWQLGPSATSLCRTYNSGHVGNWGAPVEVCHAPLLNQADQPNATDGQPTDPAILASRAVAELTVPDPIIVLDPHPTDNQWGVLAVGLPIWIGTEDPEPLSTTTSEQGITINMTATRGSILFDWGDGTTDICETMLLRPANIHPLEPSPSCGHTYLTRGDYTITATASWAITWQALDQSGTQPLSSQSTLEVPIREFEAVVVS